MGEKMVIYLPKQLYEWAQVNRIQEGKTMYQFLLGLIYKEATDRGFTHNHNGRVQFVKLDNGSFQEYKICKLCGKRM